jgi:hypothetical protein
LLRDKEITFTKRGRSLRLIVAGAPGTATLTVRVPRTLPDLSVETQAGIIDIADLDGSAVARTAGGEIHISHVNGTADLATAGGAIRLIGIGGAVRAHTSAGDITADSIGGEAQAETGGGNVSIENVGGRVSATTGGGRIRIGNAGGAVFARNGGGGAIDIGRAGGNVTASNSGGGPILIGSAASIQCQNASGLIRAASQGSFRLSTASGNVIAELRGTQLQGASFISTASGDVTLFLPSNVRAMIRATNIGGSRDKSIASDFPDIHVVVTGGVTMATGALNGGGPLLQIQATSGTISIKKK